MVEPDLGQLEHHGRGEMGLLGGVERPEEQPRLAVMVGEAFGADAQLVALLILRRTAGKGREARRRAFARAARLPRLAQAVGLIVRAALGTFICICPSRWKFITGHLAALIGSWWKFVEPSRFSCVSR